ncbi:MAG: hydroxymethylbilane synthase, partial [Actinomycetota bacterium]
ADDSVALDRLAAIDDADAHTTVQAERAFLARLGGGCDAPVGAHAYFTDGRLWMIGLIADERGTVTTYRDAGQDPVGLGERVADELRPVVS